MNNIENLYQVELSDLKGQAIDFNSYKGKVVLIVNTASKCGFTPQYEGLEKLHQEYKDKGLVILGTPCNQFGKQEPGSTNEIQEFCQVNYGVSFTISEKLDVNGGNAHPLYQWLKKEKPGLLNTEAVKWNFTKFLIDKDGNVVKRYAPKDTPESIEEHIKNLL
ncbi:glutathione peroxidase [Bacteriovoracaceae bacterium]|nr:glutathione peroxidase [Bacteriovoracaceae bacterium]